MASQGQIVLDERVALAVVVIIFRLVGRTALRIVSQKSIFITVRQVVVTTLGQVCTGNVPLGTVSMQAT